ncbi:Spy/CpxP family protein refolding chaperone [Undibacterium arcticum]|uniref:Spy/CpxP family protein refolding chaperone n=1 Tax=Undibacterium arcticum TaxID=1762892 RepID=A0ABV7EVE5_9BURK
MKKSITAACLVSGLLMAGVGSYTLAQESHPATKVGAEASQSHSKDPVVATQKRLAELKQKLNLKPTQLAAWETFSNALIAQAKAHAQSREKMQGAFSRDYENMPTPEKIEKMAAMMRSNADSLSKTASDTKIFYDVLSVEQKTIFDLFSKNAWNRRMSEHMHHDMG